MGLNKSNGNMYPYITHTFNVIKGACPHKCSYCYMKSLPGELKPVRLDRSEVKTDLGAGNFVFVGSSCDMWAHEIEADWIRRTLLKCGTHQNRYLFQSKNPHRFLEFAEYLPPSVVLATTIESDRDHIESGGAAIDQRVDGIIRATRSGYEVSVTIEPIMEIWDLSRMLEMMDDIRPAWITIGADSKGHNLPEPSAETVKFLATELKRRAHQVILKRNLGRIWNGD